MFLLRKSKERGLMTQDWLTSYHSFSFAEYYDPAHVSFGALRVINEDWIQAGKGFGMHSHRQMEIITYLLEGELAHKDSMGSDTVIHTGDIQHMSAGDGVSHSEFNPSIQNTVHLLQIWITPSQKIPEAAYQQQHFSNEQKNGRLCLVVSPDGRQGSMKIRQDAYLYVSLLHQTEGFQIEIKRERLGYLHVVRGSIIVNDQALSTGDAMKCNNESFLTITYANQAEILWFDLPPS